MKTERDVNQSEQLSRSAVGSKAEALMNAVARRLIVDPSVGAQLAQHRLSGNAVRKTPPTLHIVRGKTEMQLDYRASNFKIPAGRDGDQEVFIPQHRSMKFDFGDTKNSLSLSRVMKVGADWKVTSTGHIKVTVNGKVHINTLSAFKHAYQLLSPILTP